MIPGNLLQDDVDQDGNESNHEGLPLGFSFRVAARVASGSKQEERITSGTTSSCDKSGWDMTPQIGVRRPSTAQTSQIVVPNEPSKDEVGQDGNENDHDGSPFGFLSESPLVPLRGPSKASESHAAPPLHATNPAVIRQSRLSKGRRIWGSGRVWAQFCRLSAPKRSPTMVR